jgi:hypothetical protein
LESKKDKLNTVLKSYLESNGYTSVADETLGSITRVETTRNKVDQNKLKQELIVRGVASEVVAEAFDASSTPSTTISVKYFPPKGV